MAETVSSVFGLRAPSAKNFSKATPVACPDPQLLYGVELEIESANPDWVVPGMQVKEDGSLRNNGWEFITEPMTYSNLAYCLNLFFNKSGVNANNYSERTSVHVHTNVGDMTFDQLAQVAILYQTFEDLLFTFIGDDRDKNIFCVPWSQTTLTYDVISSMNLKGHRKLKSWQKYTALNLLPIFSIGTIEWRHMAGTPDMARILKWCTIIGRMFAWAKSHTLEQTRDLLIGLNTTSHYSNVLDEIFLTEANTLKVPNYVPLLENGVLNLKYAMIGADKTSTIAQGYEADLWIEDDIEEERPIQNDAEAARERIRERLAQHAAAGQADIRPLWDINPFFNTVNTVPAGAAAPTTNTLRTARRPR